MTALVTGVLAVAAALVFVMWPLFQTPRGPAARARARRAEVSAASDSAVRALREIEFDRATGKLSDADYAHLKAVYTARAIAELRDADAADAMIHAARGAVVVCAHCDTVRPEPDALYCSTCGWPVAAA